MSREATIVLLILIAVAVWGAAVYLSKRFK